MTVLDDTVKGTTLGDPDGEPRFVDYLGCEVPTFINKREDLIPEYVRKRGTYQRLDHHVPFAMRGEYRPEQWPEEYRKQRQGSIRMNTEGFVLCAGVSKGTGKLCSNKAVNRSPFCRNHGGALHPADKKMSGHTRAPMPEDRIENLDRVQKFMQGFLSVEELDDDEITNGFVRTSHGVPVRSALLGKKFEQIIAKELHARLNRFLMSKTPRALEVLFQIADSDLVEPADRLKAIQMITDRTMGKPADVLIHQQSEEKPYEGIIARIQGGSRDDYRKSVNGSRLAGQSQIEAAPYQQIIDAEEVDFDEPDVDEPLDDDVAGSGNNGSAQSENTIDGGLHPNNNENAGGENDASGFLSEADKRKREAAEARERIKKARARRYAKRAIGGITDTGDTALLLEFIVITKGEDIGKYRLKIHQPEKVTEKLMERVTRNNSRDLIDALGPVATVESLQQA
ncbi:hypothetical protein MADRUGA_3 [Mycobacterium phage Madruga]|uniref:Uncharacterized protein n=1 Tax=Mycobacterium phage Madruga TaxID=1675552 RepID=A0A0K1LSZ4_9CAUD|nr:hypothetical protein MADRUGA_3 [Mycobacterium phage Madruga]